MSRAARQAPSPGRAGGGPLGLRDQVCETTRGRTPIDEADSMSVGWGVVRLEDEHCRLIGSPSHASQLPFNRQSIKHQLPFNR